MKKMYILALAAATMAFSCNKNAVEQAPVQEPVLRTFTCTIAEPDTKLAIDDATGITTWEVGDKILVHGKYTAEDVTVTLTKDDISTDGKTASFSIALPATPYNPDGYYAAYPAEAYITYDSEHGYYYNTFNNTNLPLMAAYLSGSSFIFHQLTGAISFKVSGDFDEFVLKGNKGETVGYDRYNVKINSGEQNYCRETSGAKTSITAPVVADGSTVNRVFFPNGVTFSGGFTINFLKNGEGVKTLKTTESVSVARNKYRPMGDVTSYLKDYSPDTPPATTHYKDLGTTFTGATALDETKSANCYILTEKGTFKFKAVEGNDTDAKLTTIESVVVVWETLNTDTAIDAGTVIASADYHYQSGETPYIVFSTPETLQTGNALIAAKNDHGEIIWSWHIWIPAEAVTSADYTSFIGGSMMNMNLGALRAVPATGEATIESLGLLYQWGRKDPFVGARGWSDYPSKAKVAGTEWTKSKTQTSIADAIKTPTVYYYNGSDDGDWNSTPDGTLWGNSKTKYDPCPPGYKVPVNTGSLWTQTDTDWNFDTTNHVSVFAGVRLPMAGFIEAYGGSLYGTGGGKDATYIWSATKHDDNRAECVLIRTDKSPKYYKAYRGKANAGSVRCVGIAE